MSHPKIALFGKKTHLGELADAEAELTNAVCGMEQIIHDPTASPSVLRRVGGSLVNLVRSKRHLERAREIAERSDE
jgi:hypothetical protein